MNCFYCQTEIVDGHCVNRCAEKRQAEQGHIDQEYQRSILSSGRNSLTAATIWMAFILAFIAILIIEYVRGCDQAPSTPVGMTILGFCRHGLQSGERERDPLASSTLATLWERDCWRDSTTFSNPRSSSSAHTVAVGPANGLAGPFFAKGGRAGALGAIDVLLYSSVTIARVHSRPWQLILRGTGVENGKPAQGPSASELLHAAEKHFYGLRRT